ncbi:MAG: DUF1893 domain-containing protein [Dehalococcoidales bacterium]|nr:DUF1893 domain-containing protein [Dehalococcoidales bacterium]
MSKTLYEDFISSEDTLRIYEGDKLVFSSRKDRLLPLMEYIETRESVGFGLSVYDKVMGNGAALLAVMIHAAEVYSPLGSEIAVGTLGKYGVKYNIDVIVPRIKRPDGKGLCPMEELSLGKDPEEFYRALRERIEAGT